MEKKAFSKKKKVFVPAEYKEKEKDDISVAYPKIHLEKNVQQENSFEPSISIKEKSLTELEKKNLQHQYGLSEFISKHNEWIQNPTILNDEVKTVNYIYCQRLMMDCLEPMRCGVDAESIAETVGMYVGMCLASKEFREHFNRELAKNMLTCVEKHTSKDSKLRQRLEKIANSNRLLLTPEGAAITYIGLKKSAYNEMRKPNADIDKITKTYKKACQCLFEEAYYDGIKKADIKKIANYMAFANGENVDYDMPDYDVTDYDMPDYDVTNYDMPDYDVTNYDMPDHDVTDYDMPDHDVTDYDMPDHDVTDYDMPDY